MNPIKEFFNKTILDKTFWKFVLVGIANTLFGTLVMLGVKALLDLWGIFPKEPVDWVYWISSAANYVFGSILSYFLNKYFTFQSKEKNKGELWRFILNITLCYLLAYGAAKPLAKWILSGTPEIVRNYGPLLIGAGLFIILNYFGQRFFAFRKKEEKAEAAGSGENPDNPEKPE